MGTKNLKSDSISILILLFCGMYFLSCKKFLDEKPRQNLQVPSNLRDLQSLLDAQATMNWAEGAAGELSADDFTLTDQVLAARTELDRRMYTWQHKDVFAEGLNDWLNIYKVVYRANTVLESLDKIVRTPQNALQWDALKGQALLFRGKAFYQALAIWALAYDEAIAESEPGIVLKLGTDFNELAIRSNLGDSYQQCLSDLTMAASLLLTNDVHVLRATKPAAYGLLARVHLAMRNYEKAGLYADSCLQLKSDLLDFNSIDATPTYAIPQFNAEVIMDTYMSTPTVLTSANAKIVPQLYQMYEDNDLRKTLFFRSFTGGVFGWRGSYTKSYFLFTGIATDEQYLIRAESHARSGRLNAANTDLNALLVKRYKTGTYANLDIQDQSQLLSKILAERRKELLMRGLRWMDIKRLNKEGSNIALKRSCQGNDYELLPNSRRFALPIPDDLLAFGGIVQNKY